MIHSHLRMRPVRVCIGSSGWWMRGSVQAATSQEMRCWQYIMTADRSTTHTFKHTSYVKKKKNTHGAKALGKSKWTSQCADAERNDEMLSCRRKAEEGRALSNLWHTLRRSEGITKWVLTQALCSLYKFICNLPQTKTQDPLHDLPNAGFLPT